MNISYRYKFLSFQSSQNFYFFKKNISFILEIETGKVHKNSFQMLRLGFITRMSAAEIFLSDLRSQQFWDDRKYPTFIRLQ